MKAPHSPSSKVSAAVQSYSRAHKVIAVMFAVKGLQ